MTLKDKTTVTFYNGLTTIGGPMIEVAYNKSHVLFDLGEVYRPELKLPDESYQTLIKNKLIGDVPNFYDPKLTGKQLILIAGSMRRPIFRTYIWITVRQ